LLLEWYDHIIFLTIQLGITGFESSANFIEQQKPGVFPKTLRNMWVAVALFNPLISLLSLSVLPLSMVSNPNNPDILSQMYVLSSFFNSV
jgi:hypothetical protein